MAAGASLYEQDFVRWSEEQAGAIRHAAAANANLPLDWENVAEEIESLGKSQRAEFANRLETIVEHLLKLECSPVSAPRAGWRSTIVRTRGQIERLLRDSPSLRSQLAALADDVQANVARYTAIELEAHDGAEAAATARLKAGRYTVEQILGDWLPGERS